MSISDSFALWTVQPYTYHFLHLNLDQGIIT